MSCEEPSFLLDADVAWIESDDEAASPNEFLLTISELAKKFRVTPRALRFYESKGLMAPNRDRATRLYGQRDVERLALILKAKKLGFTLGDIRRMIDAQPGKEAANSLKLSRDKCHEQIGILERRMQEDEEALAELRRIHAMLSAAA